MRERRFTVPGIPSEGEVEITGNEAHHLLHVLRFEALRRSRDLRRSRSGVSSPADALRKRLRDGEDRRAIRISRVPSRHDAGGCRAKNGQHVPHRSEAHRARRSSNHSHRNDTNDRHRTRRRASTSPVAAHCRRGLQTIRTLDAANNRKLRYRSTSSWKRIFRPPGFLLTVGGPSFREQKQRTSSVVAVGPEGGWTAEEISAAPRQRLCACRSRPAHVADRDRSTSRRQRFAMVVG